MKHIAVVIDDAGGTATLCVDGTCAASAAIAGALRAINPVNNWLGRSNFSVDPELNGTLHEFRVYDAPLGASLVPRGIILLATGTTGGGGTPFRTNAVDGSRNDK